jgi:hypothetical protein
MKRTSLKKNRSYVALLSLFELLAVAFLLQFNPLTALSQAVQESAMTAESREISEQSSNLTPVDPAHQIALFALG